MSLSIYDFTIPVFAVQLENLSAWLKKAEEFADQKGIPHSEFMSARLIEDMRELPFQVWTACNTAKNTAMRVAGTENVPMDDDQVTFADLQDRIKRTLDVINAVDRKLFDGAETKEVIMKFPNTPEMKFTGLSYVNDFAIKNFFFHISIAYALLRMKGVPLGKRDYLTGGGRPIGQ